MRKRGDRDGGGPPLLVISYYLRAALYILYTIE